METDISEVVNGMCTHAHTLDKAVSLQTNTMQVEKVTCVFLVEETQGIQELCVNCPLTLPSSLAFFQSCTVRDAEHWGVFLPVRVVEPRVSLRRQSADLLPVCDQLFSLHLNLSGAQRVGLLQAVSLGTQGFDLETHCQNCSPDHW